MKEHIVPICLWIIAVAAVVSMIIYICWIQEEVASVFIEEDAEWKNANKKRCTPANYIDDHEGLGRASLKAVFKKDVRILVREIALLQGKRKCCFDFHEIIKRTDMISAKMLILRSKISYPLSKDSEHALPCL